MRIRITATVPARTTREALRLIDEAERSSADLIEVRLDYLSDHKDLRSLTDATYLPTIATVRPRWEGGKYRKAEAERIRLIHYAAASGFDYVDLELRTNNVSRLVARFREIGVKSIISHHDFDRTPEAPRLKKVLKRSLKTGADVHKIITKARKIKDNMACLKLLSEASTAPTVCFAMGPLGIPSRVLSPIFGGYFTFASIARGKESAPGQLTLKELRQIYRLMGYT